MSSKTAKPLMRSAAWRISLWATLAFACGTMLVFVFLHRFVANDIQRRSDAWLSGEVEVLGDVAERTPKNALHDRVVGEVAELAGKEVPNKDLIGKQLRTTRYSFSRPAATARSSYGLARERRTESEGHSGKQDCSRPPDGSACPGIREFPFASLRPASMTEAISILDSRSGTNCGC